MRGYQYTRSEADIYVERIRPVYEVLPFSYIEKEIICTPFSSKSERNAKYFSFSSASASSSV